ncbi:hypothetical protein CPB84DRAFT_1734897 [Gymnopilus junonius]|uniref:ABM domain-containing protein n=1 Tax=Gymnopilus junonius TaxID=109634 RepID=A0A9P5TIP0_GYMJU|nr:hypothetical protein CPB84DRAFT_1734897 [Gymnopilus junonius]
MSRTVTHSLLVPLTAQTGKENDVANFLINAHSIILNWPNIHQWYATRLTSTSPTQFLVLGTYPNDEARSAYLTGPLPKSLGENAPEILVGMPIHSEILSEIVAHNITKAGEGLKSGLSTGLKVSFKAKSGRADAVKKFLVEVALPLIKAETDTISWYALHWPGTEKFVIVDFFASDEAREAHLAGPVAAALIASIDENFTGFPDIARLDILAAKVEL